MPTPQQTVEAYLQAIADRDLDQARQYLADSRFRYTSPIGNFDHADRLIESLFGVPPILEKLTLRKCLEAGEEVDISDVCFKRDGVYAMELGGPEVGRGCGGRGIIHGFELLEKLGFHGDPEAFADLTGQPKGATVWLGGCTASFVSHDGIRL
mgnify:CR=1 FL=1